MNQRITLFLVFLAFSITSFAQTQQAVFGDHPTISPDGNTIIFSYDTDLWSVSADGGMATRLTAMDGTEYRPEISPDGKWIAFSSTQLGNPDIYIMPIGGGAVTQLTYHQAADVMTSWSWDSQSLYFTSGRFNRISTYSIARSGGTPKRLFEHYFNDVHNLVVHPNGEEVYFNESWESNNFVNRKRYKGAFNPDIKSYNLKTKTFKQLTDYDGKDFWPIIDKNGKLYFVSDEYNGEYNLYTIDNGKKKRLTRFETSIKNPAVSANGEKIVFQKDYRLWLYDVKRGRTSELDVQVIRNSTLSLSKDFKVANNISNFDVSSDGKKLAFVSRGELFVSDIKGKFIRQIETKADGRVMEVNWLKDNKTILFSQTVMGYQNWFSIAADGSAPEKKLTSDQGNNRNLSFNSDRTKAVYLSGRNEVRIMDLESMESETLTKQELWGFYNAMPRFTPDDKHILFTAYKHFEQDIYLANIESKKVENLTNTMVTETNPFISPDGKYIYYNTNRTQPSYPYGLRDADIYRMALEEFDQPYKSDKFDELFM